MASWPKRPFRQRLKGSSQCRLPATPLMYLALASGEVLPEVEVKWYRTSIEGKQEHLDPCHRRHRGLGACHAQTILFALPLRPHRQWGARRIRGQRVRNCTKRWFGANHRSSRHCTMSHDDEDLK
ncbi:hypothetical protein KYC_27953 [Achromobacter arsenitoxydans SY8]|uniref:Uncharacterized protein n=1 Tax=Achromobacter arsenitoxydans SY8 TaxID=477184 RepID=H0FFM1_9BURK|nr:hypothetical protein KYC_27953 [Achromobacter arsenitoxydans SY8]